MNTQRTARQTALHALMRVEGDESYSNITLDRELSASSLSQRDKSFVTGLFYGVLEKKLLLNYNISVLSDRPLNKLDTEVAVILRMGLYQLFFMNGVPQSAAVNETVKLCRQGNCSYAAGFVNGVLRAACNMDDLKLPDPKKGKNKYYSVKYSCPEKIIKLWRESYGDENALGLLEALDGRPPLCIRVNTLKTSAEKLMESLEQSGIRAEKGLVENCLVLSSTGAIEKMPQYGEGLFHVQDTASQICCMVLDPREGETVLDVCSAPGGKSFTCAEMMNNSGRIISCDLYENRLSLVKSGAERLSAGIIETVVCDAEDPYLPEIKADRVLCDVPCSGLGIIRRKPELRYKPDLGIDDLPEIQYRILCNASRFVKSGGTLVYSTCTLNPAENGNNVRRFLKEHGDFVPQKTDLPSGIARGIDEQENELTLFPHINGTDGFFISAFRRM